MTKISELEQIARVLRRDVLQMTSKAGSGHPSSCLSCAEIMTSLFFNEMKFDSKKPELGENDVFILSKGHAAPILYSSLKRAGCINDDLMDLRKFESELEGHPIPPLHGWVKVATGSLGQGLSVGVGNAFGARMQRSNSRVYVLLGDSECAEGSVWEAIELGAYYGLDNLCAIVDVNSLGQRGKTMLDRKVGDYKKRFESFGWATFVVDGHSISELNEAFAKAKKSSVPSVIIASTIKGKGVSFIENQEDWHGRVLNDAELTRALAELGEDKMPKISITKPKVKKFNFRTSGDIEFSSYSPSVYLSTREAYGKALANLAKKDSRVVVLDAEVSNSTFSNLVKKETPERFIEGFIAEQNLIGMALGLETRGYKPFSSSFAAFLSRAHDQLRMAAISKSNMVVCGSHAGVSIGQDGASQMGLEDIAIFRSLPNSVVFYPSDAVSTQSLVINSLHNKGITYIRTTRPQMPVIYSERDEFHLGDFKTLRHDGQDSVVLIGAGITLHEALKAHILLKKERILSAVIDLYCIKPINKEKLVSFVKAHGARVVVAEDHYSEGGIGDAVDSALDGSGIIVRRLGVTEVPHSGTKEQLLAKAGIDAQAIADAAHRLARPEKFIQEGIDFFKKEKKHKVKKGKSKVKKKR
ncbi:MAG: transketolase [Nanoarchaeota archaeon]